MSDVGLAAGLVALLWLAVSPWMPTSRNRPPAKERGETRRRRRPRPVGAEQRIRPAGSRKELRPADLDEAIVLDLIRVTMQAGVDVPSVLQGVADALPARQGKVYADAARSLRLGADWAAAWPQSGVVAQALAACWRDGIDPEPGLRFAAATIRHQRQARARQAAARLGVRLVLPLGLCFLPSFILLGLVPVMIAAGIELWAG
ncbi:MAG: type II secretion system F family protein [Beutenbergiaceae bacterium]